MTGKSILSGTWKIGVFFASTSDREVADKLMDEIRSAGFDPELRYISAHRNANELVREMKRDAYDLYVAGAGLAAHLPGVIASHTQRPVIGVPVDGAFSGVDALLSIVQMPAGVPVLSSGVEKTATVVRFLTGISGHNGKIHLVYPDRLLDSMEFKKEFDRGMSFAADAGIEVSHGTRILAGAIPVMIVEPGRDAVPDEIPGAILVPWFEPARKKSAAACLDLAGLTAGGGLWVGANNLRNGIVAAYRVTKLRKTERLIYRGSVKDILCAPDFGELIFQYSDRYSVFDWGTMPDEIPGKGEALATIADQVFRNIAIPHHSLGPVADRPRCLAVRKVAVNRPVKSPAKSPDVASGWDYSAYQNRPVDCLIPLEVLFRFGIPLGSSLPARLRAMAPNQDPVSSNISPGVSYMASLGLTGIPEPGTRFAEPIIEFSTKLEDSDRYLTYEESRQISGMTAGEFSRLREVATRLAMDLREFFAAAGLELWDGKFEFAFTPARSPGGDREFMLVDSVGPDELRLTHDGVQISKEILRQFYVDGPWHEATRRAKKIAGEKPGLDWKSLCRDDLGQRPGPLSPEVRQIAENIYPAIANALARVNGERPPFPAAWDLSHLVSRVREVGLS
jgi:phosphoribosylaminoimidazole-succinocarboxamide synthase